MRNFFQSLWRVITGPFRFLWWLIMLPVRGVRKVNQFLNYEPEEHSISDVLVETFQHPSGLLEHIDALRKHLTRMLLGLIICVGFTFFFTPRW